MLSVTIHVHRNILSAQCRIRFEGELNTLQVDCDSKRLTISSLRDNVPKRSWQIVAPSAFFIPTSVSTVDKTSAFYVRQDSLSFNSRHKTSTEDGVIEAFFRFQIPNTAALQLTDSCLDSHVDVKDFFKKLIKTDTSNEVRCTRCDSCLATINFQRVEEYCDDSSSENWFCHEHTAKDVIHRSSHCLYLDEVSIYLSKSLVPEGECKCGAHLAVEGSSPQGFTRIYFDKVVFRNPHSSSVSNSVYKFRVSLISLLSLVRKNHKTSLIAKIFLQSKLNEEDVCLLLWISSEKVAQFLLQGSTDEIPSETNLKTEGVYKVLYFVGKSSSDNVKSWRHDFSVDFYRVGDETMTMIIEYLKESTNYMPGNESTVSGFCYGCLPAYSSIG